MNYDYLGESESSMHTAFKGIAQPFIMENEEKKTEFFLTLLIAGLFHDLFYFFITTLGENFSLQSLLILYTLPNLMYTIIIGGILYYFIDPVLED